MKKQIILIFCTIFFIQLSFGQRFYKIKLKNEKIDIPNRQFYIDSIIDNRVNKYIITVNYTQQNNMQK